jgi:hypothetical protein
MWHQFDHFTFQFVSGLLACLSLFMSSSADAVDRNGHWTDRGIGATKGSCGEYVRTDVDQRRWFESWLMGYISGVNSAKIGKDDFSNGVAPQGLAQWVENYCKENPLSSFSNAVQAMLNELNKKK